MTATPSPQSVVVPDPLWMMHVIGPDDIYPAPDHATAVQWCAYLNREIAPKVPSVLCVAVPAIWTGTAEEHAEGLAEAIKGWTVPAAPAPSSLAGGDVSAEDIDALRGLIDIEFYAGSDALGHALTRILAALSPEAPARVVWMGIDAAGDAPQEFKDFAADFNRRQVALTTHHEAPAEGAGELIETIRTRLIGVSPDDQDVVLEDSDWLMIVAALEAAK